MPDSPIRCGWARKLPFPEYLRYHDEEWGVPVHDDRLLFEYLTLEGAQAGLSWGSALRMPPRFGSSGSAASPSVRLITVTRAPASTRR